MSPEEFRAMLCESDAEHILWNTVLADEAIHVSTEQREHIQATIAKTYVTSAEDVAVWIVGSAKLGFSLSQKRCRDGAMLHRYRPFGPASDIDVAVVSSKIFDQIWHELSRHSHRSIAMPWDSGRLGDYLVCGWLRPDHFPRVRLRQCDNWWDCFRRLSVDPMFGRRKVRGGLFYSTEHLQQYYIRSIQECIEAEEIAK